MPARKQLSEEEQTKNCAEILAKVYDKNGLSVPLEAIGTPWLGANRNDCAGHGSSNFCTYCGLGMCQSCGGVGALDVSGPIFWNGVCMNCPYPATVGPEKQVIKDRIISRAREILAADPRPKKKRAVSAPAAGNGSSPGKIRAVGKNMALPSAAVGDGGPSNGENRAIAPSGGRKKRVARLLSDDEMVAQPVQQDRVVSTGAQVNIPPGFDVGEPSVRTVRNPDGSITLTIRLDLTPVDGV